MGSVVETNVGFPYILTFAIFAICFGVATIVANNTLYRPDGSDISKRRIWFWVMLVISVILSIGINFGISNSLEVQSSAYKYFKHACIADGIFTVLYILVGWLLSSVMKNKKIGTWF